MLCYGSTHRPPEAASFSRTFESVTLKEVSQSSSQPASGAQMCPIQLRKKFHFLLLIEPSCFRQIVARMAEDRNVKQCDLHLLLCLLFSDSRMERSWY